MKKIFYEFLLYVYVNHIREDWEDYKPIGRAYVYLPWLIRSAFMWVISPLFIPSFLYSRSHLAKDVKKIKRSLNI